MCQADKEEVTLQSTLNHCVFLIKIRVNVLFLKILGSEQRMKRRTGDLQTKVRPVESTTCLSPSVAFIFPEVNPSKYSQNCTRSFL